MVKPKKISLCHNKKVNSARSVSSSEITPRIRNKVSVQEAHPGITEPSSSDHQLRNRENVSKPKVLTALDQAVARGDQASANRPPWTLSPPREKIKQCLKNLNPKDTEVPVHQNRPRRKAVPEKSAAGDTPVKSNSASPDYLEGKDALLRQILDLHYEIRINEDVRKDLRAKLHEMIKKPSVTAADLKELRELNELLLFEMEQFDKVNRKIQKLADSKQNLKKLKEDTQKSVENLPGRNYESAVHREMKINDPTDPQGGPSDYSGFAVCEPPQRSKSEMDLTRKLSESYDMQEKLAADNADLEVKRYILYKELLAKDQNLETCNAQIKRLQGELKLMDKENSLLHEQLHKNNAEGDATALNQESTCQQEIDVIEQLDNTVKSHKNNTQTTQLYYLEELTVKFENYKKSSLELDKQVSDLESELVYLRNMMESVKAACRGGDGQNTCSQQTPAGPSVPPMTKATPAEREVQKLTIQLRQTEQDFKTKVAECAMLRTELLKNKEELEKERCQHREVQNKLRELELKFEGLATHTNMMMGTKEQALEQEVNVRALKQCYREAREEINELRTLMKEQNDQLQDYRVKYLKAQQLVEEQRRQMDMMDMDNTRISEQINLEIQQVKLKFQEKLQELAPIPDLLTATQKRLKEAQQSQAIAEHNAEQLARELNCAREKVHVLLHNAQKPPEKPADKGNDEKQIALLQQRIAQLTETNATLKSEIDRLKANIIRMEEAVLANEKRLQEKMHECAQIGGELDRARDEAARAIQRADERTEVIRKCMQTTIADLEKQLAASRAQVATGEKEREELQRRMQCQITRLKENFEQAQLRILGLQGQVQTLRKTASSTGEGDSDGHIEDCICKSLFDSP